LVLKRVACPGSRTAGQPHLRPDGSQVGHADLLVSLVVGACPLRLAARPVRRRHRIPVIRDRDARAGQAGVGQAGVGAQRGDVDGDGCHRVADCLLRQLVLAERARLELVATGETARRRSPETRNDLTPRKLRSPRWHPAARPTRRSPRSYSSAQHRPLSPPQSVPQTRRDLAPPPGPRVPRRLLSPYHQTPLAPLSKPRTGRLKMHVPMHVQNLDNTGHAGAP
jgi:hypothetical protein